MCRFSQKNLFLLFLVLVIFSGLMSCTTLQQDRLLSTADQYLESELLELAEKIVPLDVSSAPGAMNDAREKVNELENLAVNDAVFEARLAAWSGRLFLIEGIRAQAENRLKKAKSLLPGDSCVAVLEARLEQNPATRLGLLDTSIRLSDDKAVLGIEKALVLVEMKNYREAVAAFDAAFSLLPTVYQTTYAPLREKAWLLKDLDSGVQTTTADIAAKAEITWQEALQLVRDETVLFNFITAGNNWTIERLYPALIERAILPQGTDGPEAAGDIVIRRGAAWFLWNLNAAYNSSPELLTAYSKNLRVLRNPASPIPDVPLSDPWFDSVMGCVEWALMHLPDGRNFFTEDAVAGADFLQMVRLLGQI